MPALILTGASGSGKTSIASALGAEGMTIFHFDSVGVPSSEEMVAGWGSGDAWQAAITRHWVDELARHRPNSPVLLEGQMRIAFIQEAVSHPPRLRPLILLVDCDDRTRHARLIHDRAQPELANSDMHNWAAYLRREALSAGIPILDTTGRSVSESAQAVRAFFGASDD